MDDLDLLEIENLIDQKIAVMRDRIEELEIRIAVLEQRDEEPLTFEQRQAHENLHESHNDPSCQMCRDRQSEDKP